LDREFRQPRRTAASVIEITAKQADAAVERRCSQSSEEAFLEDARSESPRGGDVMKRFLTFSLLGPAIGGLVLFHVITLSGNLDQPWYMELSRTFLASLMILPLIYLLGMLPALAIACLDRALKNANADLRMTICGAAAYVGIEAWYDLCVGADKILLVGLAGLIPSVICSWLTDSPRERAAVGQATVEEALGG
jgi:hypothetical protein